MNLANVIVIQEQGSEEETRKDNIAKKGRFLDKVTSNYQYEAMH